jgi:hypothetical protein
MRWWDGAQWSNQTQSGGQPGGTAALDATRPDIAIPGAGFAGAGFTGTAMPGGPVAGAPLAGAAGPGLAARPKGAPVPWAWVVAATPVLLLAVAAAVAAMGGETGSTAGYILIGDAVACVIAVIAAWRDARSLRSNQELAGTGIAWWSLLAPWAYLWARAAKRAGRTNLDWILLAVSLGAWLLIIAISAPIVGKVAVASTTFNRVKVQNDIARGIDNQLGVRATVACPKDPPLKPGSTFQCLARATDGSRALVNVTIQDRSGDYTWRTS